MSQVVERIVTRYYFNGRGYASRALAYVAAAKKELQDKAYAWSQEKMTAEGLTDVGERSVALTSYLHRFYMGEFPICHKVADCPFRDYFGRSCGCISDDGEPMKDWCNQKRWTWIRARAKQMEGKTA